MITLALIATKSRRGKMAAAILDFEKIAASEQVKPFPAGRTRVYAIAFDLDTIQLQQEYPTPSWQNAYGDIKKTLVPLGFTWQQGSVYFGDQTMDAVRCVIAAQTLSKTYPWFRNCVRDIRMLRIEELNDLGPAL